MAKSLKINFGYNLILTFCSYLFPLITYPYVSRVLGVDNIGICNFIDGIINYFVLFSTLGIGSYGVREIARVKEDRGKTDFVFSNLIVLNFIGTFVATILLIGCTLYVTSLQPYKEFLWIGVIKLLFNVFLIEWLYQGLQEFKYVTIRTLAVRTLYVILVFIFVRTSEDAIKYYFLSAITTIINGAVNWIYAKNFCALIFKNLKPGLFFIPVLVFGYYRILTSMYTTFNVIFLGFTCGDTESGYFATATKLYGIFMGVFTALTTVMVPRVSELLAKGEKSQLQKIADDTMSLLIIFSMPVIMLCLFCSKEIICFIAGVGYEGAETPFRIVITLLLIVGMEQIVIQQFLMATKSNKSIFTVSTIGALVGVFVNIVLTPTYGAVGSSIAWGLSEFSVLCVGFFYVRRYAGIEISYDKIVNNLLWSCLYLPILYFINILKLDTICHVLIITITTLGVFVLINFKLNKNDFLYASCKRGRDIFLSKLKK